VVEVAEAEAVVVAEAVGVVAEAVGLAAEAVGTTEAEAAGMEIWSVNTLE
jgi:hypothetical protein